MFWMILICGVLIGVFIGHVLTCHSLGNTMRELQALDDRQIVRIVRLWGE